MERFILLTLLSSLLFYCKAETTTATNYDGGDGSESNPYQIATLAQLRKLSETSDDWSKHFILTADINAAETRTWNILSGDTLGFSPIGNTSIQFTGEFNGNGHTIDGLFINRTSNFIGMFGYISNAEAKNIGLTNCDISTGKYSGGLVAYTYRAVIENCYVTGEVKSTTEDIGGLVGYLTKYSNVKRCYSSCTVSGSANVGGLIGTILYSNVEDCYVTGITTNSYGLAGQIQNGTIKNCYVSNERAFTGNILTSSISNCYYDSIRTGGIVYYSSTSGISALSTNDFSEEENFENWDFTTIWHIDSIAEIDSVKRPYLRWQFEQYKLEFKLGTGGDSLIGDTIQYLLFGESSQEVKAIASEGYVFNEWQDNDGTTVSTDNPLTLTNVISDTLLMAVFIDTNKAPVITSVAHETARVGQEYSYTIIATDSNGDSLTYSLETSPDGMSISKNVINWTPNASGSENVVIKVSDKKLSVMQSFTIVISEATGINTFGKSENIMIYPNPTSGNVIINADDGAIQNVRIFDITGKTLMENMSFSSSNIINLSPYDGNIFFISIQTKNKIITTKIIKN